MSALVALCIVVLAQNALAKLYTAPQTLPRSQYDFIVVGAGTAGNVIAARLSENPNLTVAVIEAGGNDEGIQELEIPFTAPSVLANATTTTSGYFWDYFTVPQQGLDGRSIPIQRGKLLGGTSTVNFMLWTRGSLDDFNRIARVTGDSEWSWNSIFPYFLKTETFTQPVDHHNTAGEFNTSAHGFHGPVLTTLPNYIQDGDSQVLEVTKSNPSVFPFNLDMNAGNTVGIGWMQSSTGGGQRSSSATAYLHPNLNRPNLDVLIGAQVTRLISNNTVPDLRTVEYVFNANGPRLTLQANKEVILSAGSINTPQLLLLSGVGDPKELSALGIKSVVNSPGVGQNLQDHALLEMQYFSNRNFTGDTVGRNATLEAELLAQWESNHTGIFSDASPDMVGWIRLTDNSTVFQNFSDPSAGPTSSHMEMLPVNAFSSFRSPAPEAGNFFSVLTNVAAPSSRGTIKLNSTNPFDFPLIDPAYLSNELDIQILFASMDVAAQFIAAPSISSFIGAPFGALANVTTPEEREAYVRNQTVGFWHPCCTAKMGNSTDASAVVDSHLLLKGAKGVRIVDASVLPYIPAAHPQAAVYAVAERAADIIKATYH